MQPKGLTLNDVLIATAGLIIVIALLYPAYYQSQEQSHQKSCIAHLKRIGTALKLYSQDYDEYVCPPLIGAVGPEARTWDRLILPYLKKQYLLACPSDNESPYVDVENGQIVQGNVQRSYSMPAHLGWEFDSPRFPRQGRTFAVSMAQIPFPTITIALHDKNNCNVPGGEWNQCVVTNSSREWTYRHNMRSHLLYIDGHVRNSHPHSEGKWAIHPGYRCTPVRARDSAISTAADGYGLIPRHDDIDETCPAGVPHPHLP